MIVIKLAVQTIQGIPQQQIQMAGDRPIMPVVSMSTQNGQQVQQTIQQSIPGTIQQGLPLQPNLAVTQQPMQMGMQQLHPVGIFMTFKIISTFIISIL